MIYGNYIGRNRYSNTRTLEGGNFSAVPWLSGLINGRGRYIDKLTGKGVFSGFKYAKDLNRIFYFSCSFVCFISFSFVFGERIFNPFQANIHFRYFLKTYKNQRFSDVFRGYIKETFAWNGLRKEKLSAVITSASNEI